MNRKGGFFSNFLLVLLLVALGVALYYLYQYWPREPVSLDRVSIDEPSTPVENSVPSKQFYERMRYADRVITYSIASSCSSARAQDMRQAMDNLESQTTLSFIENELEPQILVLCSDVAPEAGQENYFVAGEGGPARVLNSTVYSVIFEGKVALYREDSCSGAKVATHELLHALGFDHNNNPESILYPTLRCSQTIDSEIIQSINKLYLADSLPDLIVHSVTATKSGRYLNFHVEVLNQGLIPSETVSLGIYANDVLVETFDVGAISIGARKILDVENLKVPGDADTIIFAVDGAQTIQELDEQNNRATLRLVQQ